MKLVIDVSKKGVLDKLNAFLESFQQLQLGMMKKKKMK